MSEAEYLAAVGRLTIAVAKLEGALREVGHGLGIEVDPAFNWGVEQVREEAARDLPPWREQWVTAEALTDWLDSAEAVVAESRRIVRATRDRMPPREYVRQGSQTLEKREISLDEIATVVAACDDVVRRGDQLATGLGLTTASGAKLFGFRLIAARLYQHAITPDEPEDIRPARV